MQRIAVIGPGAVGGTVAAWLAQNPALGVTVCARTPFERLEIETPDGVIAATPEVLTDPAQAKVVDWVIIATKAYDTAGAAAWLRGLVGPATRVAVFQNGVEHVERFSPHLPRERIVPAVVDCPAERVAPGKIRQRRYGTIIVPEGDAGREVVKLFAHTRIETSTTSDFQTQVWRKLCLNCAGAVSALTLKPAGVVWVEPVAAVMRELVRECVAVGRAEGAKLDESLVETVIQGYRNAPKDSLNSMHADRLAGRPMESDARNGVVVRLGKKHGIATPINATVVALLQATEGVKV